MKAKKKIFKLTSITELKAYFKSAHKNLRKWNLEYSSGRFLWDMLMLIVNLIRLIYYQC